MEDGALVVDLDAGDDDAELLDLDEAERLLQVVDARDLEVRDTLGEASTDPSK